MRFAIKMTVDQSELGSLLADFQRNPTINFSELEIHPIEEMTLTNMKEFMFASHPQKDDSTPSIQKKIRSPIIRKDGSLTARQHILTSLEQGPKEFRSLKEMLNNRGFSGSGVGSLLKKLHERKEIERVKPGIWKLAK